MARGAWKMGVAIGVACQTHLDPCRPSVGKPRVEEAPRRLAAQQRDALLLLLGCQCLDLLRRRAEQLDPEQLERALLRREKKRP